MPTRTESSSWRPPRRLRLQPRQAPRARCPCADRAASIAEQIQIGPGQPGMADDDRSGAVGAVPDGEASLVLHRRRPGSQVISSRRSAEPRPRVHAGESGPEHLGIARLGRCLSAISARPRTLRPEHIITVREKGACRPGISSAPALAAQPERAKIRSAAVVHGVGRPGSHSAPRRAARPHRTGRCRPALHHSSGSR